jgi:opacity protein-like surface antigen
MKNSATFFALVGMATLGAPAIAETKETNLNQTVNDFEYISNQKISISEQPQNSDVNDEDSDEEERTDGFYFPLSIGGQQLNGVDAKTTINDNNYKGALNSKFGFAGETGIGYKSGDWRFDLLYGYNDLNRDNYSLSGNPSVSNQTTGSANLQTLQFGVSYDINTNSRWTPYVGGTIGAGWLSVGNSSFNVDDIKYKVKGDTASALVYGGKVGLSYKVSRRWDIFAEGAYLRTESFDLNLKADGSNKKEVTTTTPSTTTPSTSTKTFNGDNTVIAQEEEVNEEFNLKSISEFSSGIPCSSEYGPTGTENTEFAGPTPAECYDTTTVPGTIVPGYSETTTVLTKPSMKSLDFGPGNGWSAKIGFRWFFNQQDPAPVEVVEVIQEEPAPAPVYEEPVYQAPPQGTPVRALW